MNPWLMYTFILMPTLLLGLIFLVAGSPRSGILFGSSVPPDFLESPQGQRIARDYWLRGLLAVTVFIALGIIAVKTGRDNFAIVAVPVELVVWFALYFIAFRQARLYAIDPPRVCVVSLARDATLGWHLAAIAATLLPLGLAAVFLHGNWAAIPAVFPVHWNLAGHPNGWAHRTVSGVYQPIWVGCAVIAVLMLMRFLLRYMAGARNDRSPSGVGLVLSAILVSWILTQGALLPVLTSASRGKEPVLMLVLVLVLGWGAVTLSILLVCLWIFRQHRSRKQGEPYDGTPDACWRGGIFYFNPSDRAILVPKRFGIGYSLNFARPLSWLLLGVLLLPLLYFLLHLHAS